MNAQRKRKEEAVAKLHDIFAQAKIIVLAHYDGANVAELTNLRAQLAAEGGRFQITKNSLAARAIEGTGAEALTPLFSGPTAIAFSDDSQAVSHIPKIIVDFGKDHPPLRVRGGAMDGALLDEAAVTQLAQLPSMKDLRAKLIGLINSPATKLAILLNQPASALARITAVRAQADGQGEQS